MVKAPSPKAPSFLQKRREIVNKYNMETGELILFTGFAIFVGTLLAIMAIGLLLLLGLIIVATKGIALAILIPFGLVWYASPWLLKWLDNR